MNHQVKSFIPPNAFQTGDDSGSTSSNHTNATSKSSSPFKVTKNTLKDHLQAQNTQMEIRVSFSGFGEVETGHKNVQEQLKVFK